MTAPTVRQLSVSEPAMPRDPSSSHAALGIGFIAYSGVGEVEGSVVYVNYGLPADYAELARGGVLVKDRIAIARYGRGHRAVKVHTAEQAGAKALILYSDPADDGFVRGAVWPPGYWRGEQMLQRGNAKYSWYYHGDPLTPGVAATPNATRAQPGAAPTLPSIPVVVLSWGEARHVLAAMQGPIASAGFTGGLPFPYHLGPGAAQVRIAVDHDDGLKPIRNVVAHLRGATYPNRTVLLGTHHDAWTFGGVDPGTGTAALLEVAKVLGQMARGGWRPARTISFAFWDAEEYGLIGSTEYAEESRLHLQEQLVMYVNIDMYMRGRFDPGGVPSLRDFVVDVVRDVPAGGPKRSVLDGWRASEWVRAPANQRRGVETAFVPELKALGSGADFVPFQDHLGVPTLALEFIGSNGYGFGTYHTNYDSRRYVETIADPGFAQGVTMARVLGSVALRMANAEVLPFRFSHYASKLDEAAGAAAAWARDSAGGAIVSLDLEPVRQRVREATSAALRLEASIDGLLALGTLGRVNLPALNDRLARMEQLLADDDGMPDTKWYRHVFYGWNIYSLYDGQPFPGLANAIHLRDQEQTSREVGRIVRAVDRMVAQLREAQAIIDRGEHE